MEIKDWELALLPFQQATDELLVKFNAIRRSAIELNSSSPIERVEGRVKQIHSILDKCNRRGIPSEDAFIALEDIAGIRIICQFIDDIQEVVNIIRNRDGMDMEILLEEDYVSNNKPSGYRSYHITINYPIFYDNSIRNIKCELQIRTMAMNFWATIEHSLKYKFEGKIPKRLQQRLKASAEAAFNLDIEMDKIKDEINESQKLLYDQSAIVNKVLEKIHILSSKNLPVDMGKYNKKFFQLYQEENIEKLVEFNNELDDMINEV